jgi:hypothetical protein
MKHTIIVTFMVASSVALWLLNDSLRKSQEHINILAEVLEIHEEALQDHRKALLFIIEELKGKYI